MKIKYAGVALAASALLFAAGCSSASDGSATQDSPSATASATEAAGTIVDVAGENGLTTLAAAVEAAGLTETLSGDEEYTVFAPTDEAFAALPEGVLDELLKKKNQEALAKILTYHVVSGEVTSDMIEPGDVKTVEGQDVTLAVDGSTVTVNDATVTTADVQASNGVVHVIDAVILPPDVDPAAL